MEQKQDHKQPNLLSFLADSVRSLFDIDKGLPGTLKQLFIDPRPVVNHYWDKSISYFPPIRYIIILGIVYAVLWELILGNEYVADFVDQLFDPSQAKEASTLDAQVIAQEKTLFAQIYVMFNRYLAYITVAVVPLFAVFTYLLFKKDNKTFVHHLILNSYLNGQIILMYIFSVLFGLYSYDAFNLGLIPIFIIGLGYYIWATLKSFSKRGLLFKVLYSCAFLVFNILYMQIFALIMAFAVAYNQVNS